MAASKLTIIIERERREKKRNNIIIILYRRLQMRARVHTKDSSYVNRMTHTHTQNKAGRNLLPTNNQNNSRKKKSKKEAIKFILFCVYNFFGACFSLFFNSCWFEHIYFCLAHSVCRVPFIAVCSVSMILTLAHRLIGKV